MTDNDYATLARLLEAAARADQHRASCSQDPVSRYQAARNAEFFTAARRAADEERGQAPPGAGTQRRRAVA